MEDDMCSPTYWPVWMEGYVVTGNSAKASFQGMFPGDTFEDACEAWAKSLPHDEGRFFNRETLSFWGCRLYNNPTDAMAKFG